MGRYDKNRWAVIRIINASEELFRIAVNKSPNDLSALNTALLEHFMPAKAMHIKTPSGSDLSVKLDADRYRWLSNRGVSKSGRFTILPAGEVATYPVSVEGVLVADGAFNVNIQTDLNVCLDQHPINIYIKNSKVVSFDCANRQICQFLDLVFAEPYADHVGELGFGTNSGIKHSIPMNSHINERRPGVHIGFGQHNQSVYSVGYNCGIHMDMIAVGGLVWVDNASAPIDLLNLTPSLEEHPTQTFDEDIDGDCCGLWLNPHEQESCPSVNLNKAQRESLQRLRVRQGWRS
jgi:leucyl aminopeptidase (aminopeptidase T)